MNSHQGKHNTYDGIAKQYDLTEFLIAKKYSYGPTFVRLCKNIKGKRVVDAACGSGYSTRLLFRSCKPKNIIGLDSSKRMIELASSHEKENPLGIKYDCGKLPEYDLAKLKPCSVVTALFLLHYSKSKEELSDMCKSIYDALPKGGTFITITSNPEYPRMLYKKYEITSKVPKLSEGAPRIVTYWKNEKKLCSFENSYWEIETYKKAFKRAGFKKIIFHKAIVSPEGYKLFGRKFWDDYLKKPHIIGITCEK